MPIKILLVDDHRMVRAALAHLMAGVPDVAVLGEAGDGEQAARSAAELRPDVVVMDVHLPGTTGADATRRVLAAATGTRVLALSGDTACRTAVEMLRAGATGYVVKGEPFAELLTAVRAVAGGGTHFSPAVAAAVYQGFVAGGASGPRAAAERLSGREREV